MGSGAIDRFTLPTGFLQRNQNATSPRVKDVAFILFPGKNPPLRGFLREVGLLGNILLCLLRTFVLGCISKQGRISDETASLTLSLSFELRPL